MTVDISSILWMVCSASIEDKDDVDDIGNRILGDWDINRCPHVALPVPGLPQLDAVLLTHIHFDHVAGLDDLRAYCFERPFPLYARADVLENLHQRIPYCFADNPYPGVAQFEEHVIDGKPFLVEGVRVEPIPVMHYKLPIIGFRIGPLAYITDAKTIADEVVDSLKGVPLLVINSLKAEGNHLSHMCLDETLSIVNRIKPGRTYLIHMSDRMGLHADSPRILPQGVELAYDRLIVKV